MTEEKSLCRMSWAQLSTTALDAERRHDYARAKKLWEYAFYITSLTINKNLATARYSYCAKCIGEKTEPLTIKKTKSQ
ncbi:ANR family transcriptional regulator [Escherichia coli]|uniref:ANR family transcriptional regulator n=1 Tax=Escherichia coli TaxID=562 RepID=UPI001C408974|nr:ANR family transcriptional regulator [Escherichia coli]